MVALATVGMLGACKPSVRFVDRGSGPAGSESGDGKGLEGGDESSVRPTPQSEDQSPPDSKATTDESGRKVTKLTVAASDAPPVPAYIVFLVDTSKSMTNDMAKLRRGLKDLIAKLGERKLDYRIRFLTMDELQQPGRVQFHSVPSSYYSTEDLGGMDLPRRTYTSADPPEEIASALDGLLARDLDIEPGICVALEHLRVAKDYPAGATVHWVVLSDEDNALKWATYDSFSGKVSAEFPLYCPMTITGTECAETRRYRLFLDWNEYCYDYTNYRFQGNVVTPGPCERKGYSADEDQFNLKTRRVCATELYSCTDSSLPDRWTCEGGPTGKEEVARYGSPEGYRYCERAQEYRCQVLVDGVSQERRYSTTMSVPTDGSCVPDFARTQWEIVTQEASRASIFRSCGSCSASHYATVFPMASTKDNPAYKDCKIYDANFSPYAATRLDTSQDNKNRLLEIAELESCPAFYHLTTLPDPRTVDIRQDVCDSEIRGLRKPLPSSVIAERSGRSISVRIPIALDMSTPDPAVVRDLWRRQFGVAEGAVEIVGDPSRSDIRSRCVTHGPLFAASDPMRNQTGFREIITPHTAEYGDGTSIPESGVVQRRSVTRDGPLQECVRYLAPTYTGQAPTPEKFLELAAKYHPTVRMVWHSVIHLDGQPCTGEADRVLAEGKQYRTLSERTGGVVSGICGPDLSGFMGSLARAAGPAPHLEYELAGRDRVHSISVDGSGRVLESPKDYKVDGRKLLLSEGTVQTGDVLNISMDPT